MIFWKNKENTNTGSKGEDIAVKFLKGKDYKILARNFKNFKGRQIGEIDIIAEKNKEIIFVEVKTRSLEKYGETLPEENITRSKLHKLNKIANSYIKLNNLWNYPYHFDAISVWLSGNGKDAKIKHIENIFI
jgi:putative endonuclease